MLYCSKLRNPDQISKNIEKKYPFSEYCMKKTKIQFMQKTWETHRVTGGYDSYLLIKFIYEVSVPCSSHLPPQQNHNLILTSFYKRLNVSQCHSAARRILCRPTEEVVPPGIEPTLVHLVPHSLHIFTFSKCRPIHSSYEFINF